MTLYSTVIPASADAGRPLLAHAGKSGVNYTRVDFNPFLPLKAKIDCLTFGCKLGDLTRASVAAIKAGIKSGTLQVPTDRKTWGGRGGPWLAVHDPSFRDLQFIVERFWDSRLMYIEFAVDARLPRGSNDMDLLEVLKAQLRHSLFPQRHGRLSRASRKFYHVSQRRYKGDGLGTPLPDGQIIWEQLAFSDKLDLYIKEKDNGINVSQPWVRMEARLETSACSEAGLRKIGMLPNFAGDLRTYLAPMFFIASGFQNEAALAKIRRVPAKGPWSAWGAQWTADGKARLNPDAEANCRVGEALNELRFSLMRLKPPSAVAHRYLDWIDEMTV